MRTGRLAIFTRGAAVAAIFLTAVAHGGMLFAFHRHLGTPVGYHEHPVDLLDIVLLFGAPLAGAVSVVVCFVLTIALAIQRDWKWGGVMLAVSGAHALALKAVLDY